MLEKGKETFYGSFNHDRKPEETIMKILVVEDLKIVRDVICEILEVVAVNEKTDPPEPPIVITAQNGQEGLQKLMEQEFDLLVSDVDTPILDGIAMIKKAKELGRAPKDIFLVTARELEPELLEKLGVRRYFQKPHIIVEEIRDAIQSLQKS